MKKSEAKIIFDARSRMNYANYIEVGEEALSHLKSEDARKEINKLMSHYYHLEEAQAGEI